MCFCSHDDDDALGDGLWCVSSSEARVDAAHRSLSDAFSVVKQEVHHIEYALSIALQKRAPSEGFSHVLTSLTSSLLQAVLESSALLVCQLPHCNTLQHAATHRKYCKTLQHTAIHFADLLASASRLGELGALVLSAITPQHTATHCNTLQHTATHCNIL